jgi:hypothetical protein
VLVFVVMELKLAKNSAMMATQMMVIVALPIVCWLLPQQCVVQLLAYAML